MMKKLIILLVLGLSMSAKAQNTSYFLEHLPQSNLMNPALIPSVGAYVSLPGMGGVSTSIYNSGFNYNGIDKFIKNIEDNYVDEDFINSIGAENKFEFQSKVNLLAFGFKLKEKGYFSFNVTTNSFAQINTSPEVARLIAYYSTESYQELQDQFPITVENSKLLVNNYISASFTYARKIGKNLTIGVSPHINFNLLGIEAKNLSYKVDAELVDFDIETNETFEGEALVGLPAPVNPDAINGDEVDLNEDLWDGELEASEVLKNRSFSLDLGANYQWNKWDFSASVLNLGSSNWKRNGYQLKGSNDVIKIEEKKVKLDIPTQVILGINRSLTNRWNVGVMTNSILYPDRKQHAATLSLNGYVGRMLSASVSYTAGFETANLGAGARLRFFPGLDLYVVTDNVLQIFNWKETNRFTASFGMNITFGHKHKGDES